MSLSTTGMVAIVGVLAINQLVMNLGGFYTRKGVFWGLQLLNIAMSVAILLVAIPGLPRAAHWFISLYFVFRSVQNTQQRAAWLKEIAAGPEDEVDKREQVLSALKKGEDQ